VNTQDLAALGSLVFGAVCVVVGVGLLAPVGCAVLTAGVLLLAAGIVVARYDGVTEDDTGPPEEPAPADPDAPIDTRRGWPIGSRKA
jgi:hypothetical protein